MKHDARVPWSERMVASGTYRATFGGTNIDRS